jgi:flagellar biosynthetic protein FlhB
MAEDLGEKTEDATPRKLQQAREQGQVPKSTDLSAAVDLIVATIGLVVLGTLMVRAMTHAMRAAFDDARGFIDPASAWPFIAASMRDVAIAAGPFMAVTVVGALIAQYIQVGFLFTTKPLEPKLDRLNPVSGFKRIFERKNLIKTVLNAVKLIIVMVVTYFVLRSQAHKLVTLANMSAQAAMLQILQIAVILAIALLAILLIIGAADFAYQKWQHLEDQKMSKDDVKDERRSMDGDPEIKARRFRMARQIALQRLNSAVPRADVVVTNPTHFAVALRYDQDSGKAPVVVAKGADELAMRIRQIAAAHQVPIVERPPLARALYAGVPIGREINPEFYQAVAEILAYVYRLDRGVRARPSKPPSTPTASPSSIPSPAA